MKRVQDPSRRNFMKYLGFAAATLPMLTSFGRLTQAADADLKPIKEGEGIAKSLQFCSDADKGKKSICPKRAEKGREKQYCHNCQLYTKVKGEGNAEMGKCLLMPQGLVGHHGWCNSWVQKPGA